MIRLSIGLLTLLSLSFGCAGPGLTTTAPTPTLTRTFVLDGVGAPRPDVGVPGRIDHLAYDPDTQRLFVAALENGSLEVIDLQAGQRVRSIGPLGRPEGIAIARAHASAVVACSDGTVHVYDTRSLAEQKVIMLGKGADNVRYDAKADRIYVTYRDSDGGAIAVLNPTTWERCLDIRFPTRPESFQLDLAGTRVFANLPGGLRATHDGTVVVADRNTGQIETEIVLKDRSRNYPMAFDAAHERLFVASRWPSKLIVIDTRDYVVLDEKDCSEDSDDLYYDAVSNHVLVIAGGFRPDMQVPPVPVGQGPPRDETGAIDVFAVDDAGQLTKVNSVPTAPHARTGRIVPERRALYVAVPPLDGRPAEIREYTLK